MQILLAFVIFLQLMSYIIIADVILSWLTLLGLKLRPKFIADIIDPMYKNVRKIIPTSIGPIDFTPIVLIIIIAIVQSVLVTQFPELNSGRF